MVDAVNRKPSDVLDIPAGYGLLLELQSQNDRVVLHVVKDQHYNEIHPNCYAP